MRDRYPAYPTVPPDFLVPPDLQPDYLDVPGVILTDEDNVSARILDKPSHLAKQTAIIHHEGRGRREFTFADVSRSTARLANALRALGVQPGDRVAYRSSNRPEALLTSLACWRLGAIVVPTPVQARPAELSFLLKDTQAKALIAFGEEESFEGVPEALSDTEVELKIAFGERPCADRWFWWDDLLERASPTYNGAPVSSDSVALVWHTGGTTGVPKACYHTQRRFLAAGYSFARATGSAPGQRWAAAAPVGHALGFIYHTIFTLLHGATVVMIEKFNQPEELARALTEHQVDTFTAIAATWARLLETIRAEPARNQPKGIRRAYAMWQSASSSEVYDGWFERGVELLNNFGSTAFATWVLVPQNSRQVPRASLGKPAPGYEVIAVDESETSPAQRVPLGEIGRMAVRGPSGLTYWNRREYQERDVAAGWTLVDDLICFNQDGNASYLGRSDFMISTAGYKVAPVEVEQVLATHSAVREVAVIGTADAIRQEVVTAFVVLRPGIDPGEALAAELQQLVKSELAPYKYPRRIRFLDALPRDPVGKVQPRLLKDLAISQASSGHDES